MRRATWLILIGAACVGCGKKQDVTVPAVEMDSKGPGVAPTSPADPLAGRVGALDYGKLWEPDAAALVEQRIAREHFARHQAEYLAAATVGASAVPGGSHGFVAPPALAAAYPDLAKMSNDAWKERLTASAPGAKVLDYSRRGTHEAVVRVLVFRVKDDTDDELRDRFENQFRGRLVGAIKGTGVTFNGDVGPGVRIGEPKSSIYYEGPRLMGFVKSGVVLEFSDSYFLLYHALGDSVKGDRVRFQSVTNPGKGPFLVVALSEQCW